MARGRTASSAGQLFGEFQIDAGSAPPVGGQPTQARSWGIPPGSGYRDRPWKWDAPVFFALFVLLML